MAELGWTDAQWEKVNTAVTDAFDEASVATSFLTSYGPLAGSTETVRNERVSEIVQKSGEQSIRVVRLDGDQDDSTQKLITLSVRVELSSEQVAEESLSNALLAFRRAASILALDEDDIVFNGFDPATANQSVSNKPGEKEGLADRTFATRFRASGDITGQSVVSAVVQAVRKLEDDSHPSPFVCILGNELFDAAHEPSDSMVLPADRIRPLLKASSVVKDPLLRSGKMDPNTGIVVSLAATAVDLVVGTPPTVQFLQRTPDAKFLFRVYERFVLRIRDKDKPPVAGFTFSGGRRGPVAKRRRKTT